MSSDEYDKNSLFIEFLLQYRQLLRGEDSAEPSVRDDHASVFPSDKVEEQVRDQYSSINNNEGRDGSYHAGGDQKPAQN